MPRPLICIAVGTIAASAVSAVMLAACGDDTDDGAPAASSTTRSE